MIGYKVVRVMENSAGEEFYISCFAPKPLSLEYKVGEEVKTPALGRSRHCYICIFATWEAAREWIGPLTTERILKVQFNSHDVRRFPKEVMYGVGPGSILTLDTESWGMQWYPPFQVLPEQTVMVSKLRVLEVMKWNES